MNSTRRPLRRFACWSAAAVAVWLVLSSAIGIIMAESALHPVRRMLTLDDEARAQQVSAREGVVLSDVTVAADDGAMLHAWSLSPRGGNSDAVILLHGQGDNRAGMLAVADLLLRHGYAVLLPDARAQGASGGAVATYGVKEAGDVHSWYAWLRGAENPHCVDVLGESMGAAIALQSTGAVPQLCAVVAESTFSSFREAAYLRLGQQFDAGPWFGHTLLFPAVEVGFLYARLRYGVDFERASPERAAAASRVPILLIHGLADTNLPPRFSELIKADRPDAVLWEPPGAGHCGAMNAAPAEYEERVVRWFASHERDSAALQSN